MKLHVSVMFNMHKKVVRFRCIRSNGNARKRHETGNGNTGYPSCFQNGLTCFSHVSVYRFLQFRPVLQKCTFSKLLGLLVQPDANGVDYEFPKWKVLFSAMPFLATKVDSSLPNLMNTTARLTKNGRFTKAI